MPAGCAPVGPGPRSAALPRFVRRTGSGRADPSHDGRSQREIQRKEETRMAKGKKGKKKGK